MRPQHPVFAALALFILPLSAMTQCGAGEVEITIAVHTDQFGYESYWQLVPGGSICGTNTIFAGGNALVGCDGGGLQVQHPGGYGNNATILEGPWCLTDGASYDIISVDDWGDGQPLFEVLADGVVITQFQQPGAVNVFTFTAEQALDRDMSLNELTTSLYPQVGRPVIVRGTVGSFGADPVTDFDLTYRINGGAPITANIAVPGLTSGQTYEFEHPTPWVPVGTGTASLEVWISGVNGSNDLNLANDSASSAPLVSAAIPNIIDQYLTGTPVLDVIANSNQDLLVPRDLDFHPDLARNELWVINKDVESSGGSTVKFTDVGGPTMTWLWQRDPDAWHFMSLPTGIAFGDNGNFSTCPGVYDANHNGPPPFTGPTLWDSDPAVYAQTIFGPLGSHIDMLHVTPNSQGIAHDRWNRYWVVDGYTGDVVMHDFRKDHGPGNDYHGDAIIRRYADFTITRDPNDHVVSHCVLDGSSGWLYVVDFGGQRVLRLDTHTGTVSGPGSFGPYEPYVEYSEVSGYDWNVVVSSGLIQPAGIDLIGERLLVSDHANGDVIVFDLGQASVPEIGRIHTNAPGIMGVKVGPDGRIWYVNASTHELVRISPAGNVGLEEATTTPWSVAPNPASDMVWISGAIHPDPFAALELSDVSGRLVGRTDLARSTTGWDISHVPPGVYMLRSGGWQQRLVIAR